MQSSSEPALDSVKPIEKPQEQEGQVDHQGQEISQKQKDQQKIMKLQEISQLQVQIQLQENKIKEGIQKYVNLESELNKISLEYKQNQQELNQKILNLEQEKQNLRCQNNDLNQKLQEVIQQNTTINGEILILCNELTNRINNKQFFQIQDLYTKNTKQEILNLEKLLINFIQESQKSIQVSFNQNDNISNGIMILCSNGKLNEQEFITIQEFVKQDFQIRKYLIQVMAEGIRDTVFLGVENQLKNQLKQKLDELGNCNEISVDLNNQTYWQNHEKFYKIFTELLLKIIQQTKNSSKYLKSKQQDIGTIEALKNLQQKYSVAVQLK